MHGIKQAFAWAVGDTNRRFVVVLIIAAAVFAVTRNPGHVKDAQEQLEIHYYGKDIFRPVQCPARRVDGRWWIYCHPYRDTSRGGLYALNDSGALAPANGTAKLYGPGRDAALTVDDVDAVLSHFR